MTARAGRQVEGVGGVETVIGVVSALRLTGVAVKAVSSGVSRTGRTAHLQRGVDHADLGAGEEVGRRIIEAGAGEKWFSCAEQGAVEVACSEPPAPTEWMFSRSFSPIGRAPPLEMSGSAAAGACQRRQAIRPGKAPESAAGVQAV